MILVASLAGGAAIVARRASRRADEIASQLRLEREGEPAPVKYAAAHCPGGSNEPREICAQ